VEHEDLEEADLEEVRTWVWKYICDWIWTWSYLL